MASWAGPGQPGPGSVCAGPGPVAAASSVPPFGPSRSNLNRGPGAAAASGEAAMFSVHIAAIHWETQIASPNVADSWPALAAARPDPTRIAGSVVASP